METWQVAEIRLAKTRHLLAILGRRTVQRIL
jgi:hypothetical protein